MRTITKYVLYVDSAQRTGVTLGQGGRTERRGKRGQEERQMRGYHGKGKGETGADEREEQKRISTVAISSPPSSFSPILYSSFSILSPRYLSLADQGRGDEAAVAQH